MNFGALEIHKKLLELLESGSEGVLLTVIEKKGSGPAKVDEKMLVFPDGDFFGNIGGGTLEAIAIADAKNAMKTRKSFIKNYNLTDDGDVENSQQTGMLCGGNVSIFIEYIALADKVFIFGAGHIGKALAYHIKNLPFRAVVVDTRADSPDEINGAKVLKFKKFIDFFDDEKIPQNAFFVISTYSHETDYRVLKALLLRKLSPKYIGMLASQNKARSIVKRITDEFDEEIDLSVLHSPVGLDIGGDSPDEIAMSIIAEMLVVKYQRDEQKNLTLEWNKI